MVQTIEYQPFVSFLICQKYTAGSQILKTLVILGFTFQDCYFQGWDLLINILVTFHVLIPQVYLLFLYLFKRESYMYVSGCD